MSAVSMPFLVINLGVEMIFVLYSRLRAQAVPIEKSTEVMRDIAANIFSTSFLDELFRPQELYAPASMLQIFTALSTSTSMHLSTHSLRKLYDLVSMTVKYQVYSLRHPLELLEYTLIHLDQVPSLAPADVHASVQATQQRVCRLAATLSVGDWAAVRRNILNFFLDRRVRVSFFLEDGLQQSSDGSFVMPPDRWLSPTRTCEAPGVIEMVGRGSATFGHPDASLGYPPHVVRGSWDPQQPSGRVTKNGTNLYSVSSAAHPGEAGMTRAGDALSSQTRDRALRVETAAATPVADPNSLSTTEKMEAYHAESNYLSQLVASSSRVKGMQRFELDLFADETEGVAATAPLLPTPVVAAAATPASPPRPPVVDVSRMTPATVQQQNRELLGIITKFDQAEAAMAPATTASDLLDIMDEV